MLRQKRMAGTMYIYRRDEKGNSEEKGLSLGGKAQIYLSRCEKM